MSQRQSTVTDLHEELRIIEVFDRLHDHLLAADPVSDRLYANRQVRRKQVMEEMARLKAHKFDFWGPARFSGAIAIICAVGYIMIHYSFK